jgi:hypothetical protein
MILSLITYFTISILFNYPAKRALNGSWTHDLALTKGALYQLSYEGLPIMGLLGRVKAPVEWTVKDSNLRRRVAN